MIPDLPWKGSPSHLPHRLLAGSACEDHELLGFHHCSSLTLGVRSVMLAMSVALCWTPARSGQLVVHWLGEAQAEGPGTVSLPRAHLESLPCGLLVFLVTN